MFNRSIVQTPERTRSSRSIRRNHTGRPGVLRGYTLRALRDGAALASKKLWS